MALGVMPSPVIASDLDCLAQVIHHEARGEPYNGKLAVGHVVLNRVKSKRYPNNVCSVVTQPHQFTNFRLGAHKPSADSLRAAKESYTTPDNTNGALYFESVRLNRKGLRIGNHTFRR